jgi:hypothetical protein
MSDGEYFNYSILKNNTKDLHVDYIFGEKKYNL